MRMILKPPPKMKFGKTTVFVAGINQPFNNLESDSYTSLMEYVGKWIMTCLQPSIVFW